MNLNEYIVWMDEVTIKTSQLIHMFLDNKDTHVPNPGIKRLMEHLSYMNTASVVCKSILTYQFSNSQELIK